MEVSIIDENNLINIEYKNNQFIFLKNSINILFIFDNDDCNHMSFNRYNLLNNFLKIKNKCLKYLIFIYEFHGDDELLIYFKENYNFNFINYVNLNLYWYSLIYRYKRNDYIYEEKIFNDLNDKVYLNIDLNYDDSNTERHKNIDNDIKLFDTEINNFISDLKNISLDEINNRKKRIYLQYDNLEKYI